MAPTAEIQKQTAATASDSHAAGIIRGLTRVWKPRSVSAFGDAQRVMLHDRVARARGLVDPVAAEKFLAPALTHLHDPALLPGLERAAARMLAAARSGERMVIYGDYDVDGVTATAILYHTLKAIAPGCALSTYVPHRLEEGYGLSAASVRELCERGEKVIVSVDCGVTAFEPARVAKDAGVDLIITDHHNLPTEGQGLPDAYAIVHPRLPGSNYPFGELCGAGVAFKLAWRLLTLAHGGAKLPEAWRGLLLELLGLCALGVIADVVPLVDENRVIARFGLVKIKYTANPGLAALVEASGLGGENVQAEDVGFKLGPRLNACGRMGHAREAVELLTTATGERAAEIAAQLSRLNTQRQATERGIVEQACAMAVDAGMTTDDTRAIVLAHPEWHAGVVGIVCSRLVEKFARPVVMDAQTERGYFFTANSPSITSSSGLA